MGKTVKVSNIKLTAYDEEQIAVASALNPSINTLAGLFRAGIASIIENGGTSEQVARLRKQYHKAHPVSEAKK